MCKGLSFCPTPSNTDYDELSHDLFDFTRYHFRNYKGTDESIVKLPSEFNPKPYVDAELEEKITKIRHLPVNRNKRNQNNLSQQQSRALKELERKVEKTEVVIKSADKGDITVVMSPQYYRKMCEYELQKNNFYKSIGSRNPESRVLQIVKDFAVKYKSLLTAKEFEYITKRTYRMANFYCLPKLHKSEDINSILSQSVEEYVQIPNYQGNIVGGPIYHTSGLSEIIDIILKPFMSYIPHIVKDSFDLIDRVPKTVPDGTKLGSADIKALYTNLSFDLVLKSVEYWVTKFSDQIPLLQRFSLSFINEALKIILENNFFVFDEEFIQQIMGFAMGTKSAVQCANLSVAYLEVKMFALLPTIYPDDFVDFLIRSYFRFLDDIFHLWLDFFDIRQFYEIFESLDENLKFIFFQYCRTA